MTILRKLQSTSKHDLSPSTSRGSTVWFFFFLGKNGINLVIVSLIFFTARHSFSPFSSYPLFTFFGIKVIVLRYGSENYLVQSPFHSSWLWKDSSTSVLGNGIISTVSSRNPFRYVYSLFHYEFSFILSPASLSVPFWGSATHVSFVQNHDFFLSTPAHCQQHWKKMTIKLKFYF